MVFDRPQNKIRTMEGINAKLVFIDENMFQQSDLHTEERAQMYSDFIKKYNKKEIRLPCTPTRDMALNLPSFKKSFGFSTEYCEFLKEHGLKYMYIQFIQIHEEYVEIWVISSLEEMANREIK